MEGMFHYMQFCLRLLLSRPRPMKLLLHLGPSKMSWASVMNLGIFAFPLLSKDEVPLLNTGLRIYTHNSGDHQIHPSGKRASSSSTFGAPARKELVFYQMFHLMPSFPGESGTGWIQKSSLSVHHFPSQNTIKNYQLASVLWEKISYWCLNEKHRMGSKPL